ncbi:hypothetical protein ACRJ4W_29935 [Streptomyces sp. GLT-R25]
MTYTEATGSQGRSARPDPPGARNAAATRASRTTGTLTRNTEPHQKCSSRKPPRTGPSAVPTTDVVPQIPIATPRSRSSSKVSRISASVEGIIVAAPTARKARAVISIPGEDAKAAIVDAAPKTTRPARKSRLCPTRSPSVPVPSSRPADTSG